MSQFKVLLLSSLPLLGIFGIGIVSCMLLLRLDSELEQRKKQVKEEKEKRELARRSNQDTEIQMSDINESEEIDQER